MLPLAFLTFLVFQYSKDKLNGFSQCTELLGVELNLEAVSSGCIKVQNKKSRVEEAVGFLKPNALGKKRDSQRDAQQAVQAAIC